MSQLAENQATTPLDYAKNKVRSRDANQEEKDNNEKKWDIHNSTHDYHLLPRVDQILRQHATFNIPRRFEPHQILLEILSPEVVEKILRHGYLMSEEDVTTFLSPRDYIYLAQRIWAFSIRCDRNSHESPGWSKVIDERKKYPFPEPDNKRYFFGRNRFNTIQSHFPIPTSLMGKDITTNLCSIMLSV